MRIISYSGTVHRFSPHPQIVQLRFSENQGECSLSVESASTVLPNGWREKLSQQELIQNPLAKLDELLLEGYHVKRYQNVVEVRDRTVNELSHQVAAKEHEIRSLLNSNTYRLGRAITSPLRTLRDQHARHFGGSR